MKKLIAIVMVLITANVFADCQQRVAEFSGIVGKVLDVDDFCVVMPSSVLHLSNHILCPITSPIDEIIVNKAPGRNGTNCGLVKGERFDGYLIQNADGTGAIELE